MKQINFRVGEELAALGESLARARNTTAARLAAIAYENYVRQEVSDPVFFEEAARKAQERLTEAQDALAMIEDCITRRDAGLPVFPHKS